MEIAQKTSGRVIGASEGRVLQLMILGPNESLDIANLRSHYADGQWTVEQVVDSVLDRIAACPDRAIFIDLLPRQEIDAQIKQLTRTGKSSGELPLYGVPFAVKDNIDVAGRPTTAACPAFAYTAEKSATVVQKLCDAGAILVGKTNLDQFATGLVGVRSPYGVCENPFDPRYIPGGSSSGSATAVSRGLVSFALGTDTAGSGRIPAAFNNIVGIKPSRGLLSNAGVVPACMSLDCVSVFSLTCADGWQVVQGAAGFDPSDPYSRRPEDFKVRGAKKGELLFGVPTQAQLDFFGNEEYRSLYENAVARMVELGGKKVVVDCQPFFDAGQLLYDGPWLAERLGGLRGFLEHGAAEVLPVIRTILDGGRRYNATECFDGIHRLAGLVQAARSVWEQIKILMVPTAGTIHRLDEIARDPVGLNRNLGRYASFVNLMDLCAVAVPAGFGKDGLPGGVTLIAPAGSDLHIVELAERLHRVTSMKLGATGQAMPALSTRAYAKPAKDGAVKLAVVGAHLSGQPLNWQLTNRGAELIRSCRTFPAYRLYALAGTKPAKPGLVRVEHEGAAIEVEVWEMDAESFGSFVADVPAPMVIGAVQLEDGSLVKGFLCEPYAVSGSVEITSFGGWRAYLKG